MSAARAARPCSPKKSPATIRHKHEETGIPVISCVSSAAASGGYWIALAGNEVYTLDNSLVGSIGVIASTFNFSDTIQRIGVQRKELTVGSHKGGLDPFLPHSEDREQEMKRLMNDLAENFYTWVKERRGNKLQQQPEDIFNGRVWIGSKATEIGLIDGTGSLESVLKKRYPRGYNPKFLAPRSRTGIFSAMAASAGAAFAEAFGSTILARLGIDDTDRYTFR